MHFILKMKIKRKVVDCPFAGVHVVKVFNEKNEGVPEEIQFFKTDWMYLNGTSLYFLFGKCMKLILQSFYPPPNEVCTIHFAFFFGDGHVK